MFDFVFDTIHFQEKIVQLNGVHLWILHADKIPPHIGISVNNTYFSLKAKGKDEAIAIQSILQVIDKKKISTILVQLKVDLKKEDLNKEYANFERAFGLETSCLVPIKNCLEAPKSIQKLSDLLHFLQEQHLLLSVFGLHLTNEYKGIKSYSIDEIQQRIEKLNDVEGKNNLS
jgi:RNase H-fold protein (predicted Holliday junction resolvase)